MRTVTVHRRQYRSGRKFDGINFVWRKFGGSNSGRSFFQQLVSQAYPGTAICMLLLFSSVHHAAVVGQVGRSVPGECFILHFIIYYFRCEQRALCHPDPCSDGCVDDKRCRSWRQWTVHVAHSSGMVAESSEARAVAAAGAEKSLADLVQGCK